MTWQPYQYFVAPFCCPSTDHTSTRKPAALAHTCFTRALSRATWYCALPVSFWASRKASAFDRSMFSLFL
jgi:hypothetical protein